MEEQILTILKKDNRAFSIFELNDALKLKTAEQLKQLIETLDKLESEMKVYHTKKNSYLLFNNSNLKTGTLLANKKGFGFVRIDKDETEKELQDDIFIAPININGAIHGDKVVVELLSKKGTDPEGRIVKTIKRELKQMVGEFYRQNGKGKIKLDDEKVKLDIVLNEEQTKDLVDGHKVLIKIIRKQKDNKYYAEIVKVLGHKNDPGVDILSITSKYDIHDTFPKEVLQEIETINDHVLEEEMIGRKDLRNEEIFTIDGADTKDIDDAISYKKLSNGNHQLGVHIADVSYYVKENSPLDKEAYERGTSSYLADRVIPMLPHKLSNGICSLNPNADRLALSCIMEIDATGKVVDYEIVESIIKSKKKMTYKEVNQILEKNQIPEGYQSFANTLKNMNELAHILRKYKTKRGNIDFDIDESKIIVNEKGEAIDVVLRERGEGQRLIEDFMIAANETIASHIYYMELPFIYRVHGEPNEDKITSFLKFVSVLGYKITGNIKNITPTTMQNILAELKDKKEYHILSALLLRSMQKAVYDQTNIGHFGLASPCYTHFTSPIRRYPDLIVHRLLRTYLFKQDLSVDTIAHFTKQMPFIAEHTSQKERNAIECEREVDDMKKAEYMSHHIGENYTGIVSSVTNFGMFVELPNLVEGLIRIESIKKDQYFYDENTYSLRSSKDTRGFRLGDTIEVTVLSANKEAKTVDFVLAQKKEQKKEKKRKKLFQTKRKKDSNRKKKN